MPILAKDLESQHPVLPSTELRIGIALRLFQGGAGFAIRADGSGDEDPLSVEISP